MFFKTANPKFRNSQAYKMAQNSFVLDEVYSKENKIKQLEKEFVKNQKFIKIAD